LWVIRLTGFLLVELYELDLVDGGEAGIGRGLDRLVCDSPDGSAIGECGQCLLGRHGERGIVGEPLVEGIVVDGVRVQLLLKPCIDAGSEDALNITGTRAEGEAIENLGSALTLIQRYKGCSFCRCRGFGF